MRKVLIATAAALALSTSAAFATPIDLKGSYTVSEQYSGGPTIVDELGIGGSFTITNLTVGTETAATDFFKAEPNFCSGTGCTENKKTDIKTETEMLTIDFTDLSITGISGEISPSVTATFTAQYGGTELACAKGDGVSPKTGDTDCLVWTSAPDTYNGSLTLIESLGNGQDLDIILNNATDWDVTPTISFELTGTPDSVPEPGSLGLLLTGLAALGLGLIGLRRRTAS